MLYKQPWVAHPIHSSITCISHSTLLISDHVAVQCFGNHRKVIFTFIIVIIYASSCSLLRVAEIGKLAQNCDHQYTSFRPNGQKLRIIPISVILPLA